MDEAGEAGERAENEQDAAKDMGKCDVIAHKRGREGAKGHLVGDEVEHGAHIHQEIDAFITEKGTQEDPDHIEPLGMVGVAPMFYTLYEVHDGIVLGKKKSFLLNIQKIAELPRIIHQTNLHDNEMFM